MRIERKKILNDLEQFVRDGNGVIIGQPGVGKTYLLLELRKLLEEKQIPHLLFPIDQLGQGNIEELQSQMKFTGDLIKKIRVEMENKENLPGILLFDAFDSARNEGARNRFINIIKRTVYELKDLCKVIVTVRTYDANKSQELIQLFGNSGKFESKTFADSNLECRNFKIPPLQENEIRQAFSQIENLESIYQAGSSDFKKLLSIPFNLWLMEKILNNCRDTLDFSPIHSEVQLLDIFWDRYVRNKSDREDREYILTSATRSMVQECFLSVRKEGIYKPEFRNCWTALLSDELLIEVTTTKQRVAFSHNILFDYAVSLLLLEDDPLKLGDFLSEDQSRILFLRPSIVYYLTRLWHLHPTIFWKVFKYLLSKKEVHLRLFARLLPVSVIANEAREVDQLTPLIDCLEKDEPIGLEATLRLLQALRSLQIKNDVLWIRILEKIAKNVKSEFAWDLSLVVSEIIDRAEQHEDNKIFNISGHISRILLKWVWSQRENDGSPWLDSLGSNWVVPMVSKTFSTDSEESRILLENVLTLLSETNFPIKFLFSLTDDLNRIWSYDPQFAAQVYIAVFGHYETSEDTTSFGTPVLPLMSTRRQDYDMCYHRLVWHFPHFLRHSPEWATRASIYCLNRFIISQHIIGYLKKDKKLEDIVEEFSFRGKTARYLHDNSYIWDEAPHGDLPLDMANKLFNYLSELASSSNKTDQLNELIDIFSEINWVAYFWRHLLKTATQKPEIFSNILFELCIARPIQMGFETSRELGMFLESASEVFGEMQIQKIEQSILNLPKDETDERRREIMEDQRNLLLARFPYNTLQTEEAKIIIKELQKAKKVPQNEPLISFNVTSQPYTDEMRLERLGVDLKKPSNKLLQEFFPALDQFSKRWMNDIPDEKDISTIFPILKDAHETLASNDDADKSVQDTLLTKICSCIEKITKSIKEPNNEVYRFARGFLLDCSYHELPIPDPKYDENYNSPSWTSSPRIEAAQGIPRLAAINPDEELLNALEQLSEDKVPAVRFLTARELFRLSEQESDFFWRLVGNMADREQNPVVQQAICSTLSQVIEDEETKTVTVLDKIVKRTLLSDKYQEQRNSLISIVMWLVIVRHNEWAIEVADKFLKRPVELSKQLKQATRNTLSYINPEIINSSDNSFISDRAIEWIQSAIKTAANSIEKLISSKNEESIGTFQSKLREIYGVIDEVITRLYFAADVNESLRDKEENPISDEERKNYYLKIKPLLDQVLEYSTKKEMAILLAPTAHHFMEILTGVLKYDPRGVLHLAAGVAQSGKAAGYNLDSLAIREVVKLVEIILADYRHEVRGSEPLQDLLALLDIFAGSGWPEALQLVWRLDEIYR